MTAVGRSSKPDVDKDVENCAAQNRNQLGLFGWRRLKMQSTNRSSACRQRQIVLDALELHPMRRKRLLVILLDEKSTRIVESLGFEQQGARKLQRCDFHHMLF